MWPFLIGLALSVIKTFATSTATSAGAKLGELMISSIGPEPKQIVFAGSQPSASRQQQVSATQQLLTALKTDEAFRHEVRAILQAHAPAVLAEGEQVQRDLENTPAVVQEVVTGALPATDFLDPLYMWKGMTPVPISADQETFLRSPIFDRVCPIGGERLAWDDVHYEMIAFIPPWKVHLPKMPLPGAPKDFVGICTHGHRWPVFASGQS